MKFLITLIFAQLLSVAMFGDSLKQRNEVLGDWEGESLCTIKDSPCRDEHVIYHVKPQAADPQKLEMSANKVVNGEEQYMGSLTCDFKAADHALHCQYKSTDDWNFKISGDTMTGTLIIPENKLYRRISVKRVQQKN
jgi:hypothetical protein